MYPIDPKTKEPSVSLGLLLLSTFLVVLAIGLDFGGIIKTEQITPALELFFGCASLYFGRRVTFSKDAPKE